MLSSFSRATLVAAAALAAAAPLALAAPLTPAPIPSSVVVIHAERHPEIRRAITSLERARSAMQSANHDFGGHRAAALAACDNAIAQLKLALQFDR